MEGKKQGAMQGNDKVVTPPNDPPRQSQNTATTSPTTPPSPLPHNDKKSLPTVKKTARPADKAVEINIVIPAFTQWHRPRITDVRRRITTLPRKTKLIGGTMIAIALVGLGGYYWLNGNSTTTAIDPHATDALPDLVRGTPEYATILPAGKTIESLGGWTRISPPGKDPVFTYTDTIGGSSINVSQQPLPDDFRKDTAKKVEQLAIDFNANEKATVGSTVVHIGTSATGVQSVIFYKGNLLILIKSTAKIQTNQWTQYISSLQ